MSRALLLLATLLLGACGTSSSLPAPEILSVSPNRVLVNNKRDTPVEISLDTVLPVQVDYAREKASPTSAQVWFGDMVAELETLEADGTLTVKVPENLGRGQHDVRVALSDGREAVRDGGFTISTPNDDPDGPGEGSVDAGDLPEEIFDAGTLGDLDGGRPLDGGVRGPGDAGPLGEGDVTGFEFEPIGNQQRGERFEVTIHAIGPRAHLFQGSVEVKPSKQGSVSPTSLGPFTNGEFQDFITVDAKGGNIKLTVTDAWGAQGTSNGFKVK